MKSATSLIEPRRYLTGTRRRHAGYDRPPMAHRVTLIPGDGTGPELTEATRRVLEATGVEFDWDVRQAGVDVMEDGRQRRCPRRRSLRSRRTASR